MSDDWIMARDFDSNEPLHSRPRWEYQNIDAGQTVLLRITPAGPGKQRRFEVPTEVLRALDLPELDSTD